MKQLKNRFVLLGLSVLLYVALFIGIGAGVGHGAIVALIPVLTASLCWGWKAGLAAGACAFPVNVLMMTAIGLAWRPGMLSGVGITGHIAFVFEGVFVGLMRDFYVQRQQAISRLQQEMDQRARDMEILQTMERRLDTIIQESADAIFITTAMLNNITMANRAFLELVGCTAEQVTGHSIFEFMPDIGGKYTDDTGAELVVGPQLYEGLFEKTIVLNDTGRASNLEFYLLHASGRCIPVEANAAFFYTSQNEREGTVVIVRDITHRKRIERQLEETNDFLENIIESSLDAIMISDATGHITGLNQATLDLMGYERQDLLGQTPVAFAFFEEGAYETTAGEKVFVSQQYLEDAVARMDVFFREGKIRNYRYFIIRNDRRLVEVEANIVMLHNRRGKPAGAVSVMRDITVRRSMENELARQHDQLAAANSELESFAYSVSHDLRAPLRSISGFSSAIAEDFGSLLPPQGQHYLERICAAAGRMGVLIDDLLNLSRVTRQEMRCERVNLSALAAEAAAQLQDEEPGRSAVFTIQPGLFALADGNLLRIVMENLFGNAWKYAGRQPEARISFAAAESADEGLPEQLRDARVYCIRDNGVGFDMAYAEKLFSPFQRLHAEGEFPGTGIGLATVQRIVHRHGGRIWARSAPGAGAAFYFTLPQEGCHG